MTTETSDPQLDHAKLKAEQDGIMAEQASGAWGPGGPMTLEERWSKLDPTFQRQHASMHAWDEAIRLKIKRGIEVTALLRRTNTGPAKPKSKRRGSKVDIEAITEELLK